MIDFYTIHAFLLGKHTFLGTLSMGKGVNELGNWKDCTAKSTNIYYVVDFKKEDVSPLGYNNLGVCLDRATYPTTESVKLTLKPLFLYY